ADDMELRLNLSSADVYSEQRHQINWDETSSHAAKAQKRLLIEAGKILDDADPRNFRLLADRVILLHKLGKNADQSLQLLRRSDHENGPPLADDLSFAFGDRPPEPALNLHDDSSQTKENKEKPIRQFKLSES